MGDEGGEETYFTLSLNALPVFLGLGVELLPASDGGKAIKSASDIIATVDALYYRREGTVYRAWRANLHCITGIFWLKD